MRMLIVGAAPVPGAETFYRDLLQGADAVVAADAAGEWCAGLGRLPDVVVGDFDSADPGAPTRLSAAGVEVIEFPVAKDRSDLDLAAMAARDRGATSLVFTAAFSQRLDHTVAAIGTLLGCVDLCPEVDEPGLALWMLHPDGRRVLTLDGAPGSIVSVFAVGGVATGVTLEGFRYPVGDATFQPLSSLGLSNVLAAGAATVSVRTGALAVLSPGPPDARAKLAAA